jgi:hypothetical protein
MGETFQGISVVIDDAFADGANVHAQTRIGITRVVLDEPGIDSAQVFVEIARFGIVVRPRIIGHTTILRRRVRRLRRK